MNLDQIIFFMNGIPSMYTDLKKDGLDQFRGIIKFLKDDLYNDIVFLRVSKNPYMKYRIKQQIEKWTIPQIKHYMEKIDKYIKYGWVDKS